MTICFSYTFTTYMCTPKQQNRSSLSFLNSFIFLIGRKLLYNVVNVVLVSGSPPLPFFFFGHLENILCILQTPASLYSFQMCPCWRETQDSTRFSLGWIVSLYDHTSLYLSSLLTTGIRGTSGFWQSGKTMNATFSYTAHGVLLSEIF